MIATYLFYSVLYYLEVAAFVFLAPFFTFLSYFFTFVLELTFFTNVIFSRSDHHFIASRMRFINSFASPAS